MDRGRLALFVGAVAAAGLVVLVLVALLGVPSPQREGGASRPRAPSARTAERVIDGRAPGGGRGEAPRPGPGVPGIAEDLAARLARAWDGGASSLAGLAPPLEAPDAAAPGVQPTAASAPRPPLRLARPLGPREQLEYAARLHDYIVLRRDDLGRRLEHLERAGQGESAEATRLRRELARLAETEPAAARQVQQLARRVQAEPQGASEPHSIERTVASEGEASP